MILDNRIAIVTGASRGIGQSIAMRFAKEGATVVVTATTAEGANKTVSAIEQTGGKALGVMVDVSEFDQCENLIKTVVEKFLRIDILVNNAGVTQDNLLVRMKQDEWERVLDVNLKGAFNCIRAATKTMMKQREGKIVNITSVVGLTGNAGQANYSASKAGLVGLTKSVAKELAARNIQVNAIAPGYIETDMTKELSAEVKENLIKSIPLGRIGKSDEVAALAVFLSSESSNYITGQVITIDGGMVM